MRLPRPIDVIAYAATFAVVTFLLMCALAFLYEALQVIKAAI